MGLRLLDAVEDAEAAVHGAECLYRVEIALEQSIEAVCQFGEHAPTGVELPVGTHVQTPLHDPHVLVKLKVAPVARLGA